MANLTIPQQRLPSKGLRDYEVWLAGRIETLLSHYFIPNQNDAVATAAASDWMDILGGLTQDAVSKACLEYMRTEPTRRPTPGAIYALAKSYMPKPQPVLEPEPRRHVGSPESARRILAEAGYRTDDFGRIVSLGGLK